MRFPEDGGGSVQTAQEHRRPAEGIYSPFRRTKRPDSGETAPRAAQTGRGHSFLMTAYGPSLTLSARVAPSGYDYGSAVKGCNQARVEG